MATEQLAAPTQQSTPASQQQEQQEQRRHEAALFTIEDNDEGEDSDPLKQQQQQQHAGEIERALGELLALAFPEGQQQQQRPITPSIMRTPRALAELPDQDTLARNLLTSTPAPPPPPPSGSRAQPAVVSKAAQPALHRRLAELLAPHVGAGPEVVSLPRAEQRRVVRARGRALEALFANQTAYVSALDMLCQAYGDPLGGQGSAVPEAEWRAMQLGTARQALDAGRAWLESLAKAAAAAPAVGHARLGPVAAELVASPAMRLHGQLCAGFRGAIDAYGQALNSQTFAAFVVGRQRSGYGSLPALVRACIDGIPAYDILLDAVRSATWASHPDAADDFGKLRRAASSLHDSLARAAEQLLAQENRAPAALAASVPPVVSLPQLVMPALVAPLLAQSSSCDAISALAQPWADVVAETVSPLPLKARPTPAALLLDSTGASTPSPPQQHRVAQQQHAGQQQQAREPRQCARLPTGRELSEAELEELTDEELEDMRVRLERAFSEVELRLRDALEQREQARDEKDAAGHEVEQLLAMLRTDPSKRASASAGSRKYPS
eukprot:m51a1_g7082 hypothetical protein (554) ;mRNA; r:7251-9479